MLSDIPENAPSETLFSFYDTPFRRPYQAYCVTEASSRPPSPDPLVQEPFCASAPPLWPAADRAHFTDTERFEQNNSRIQAAASSPENAPLMAAAEKKLGPFHADQWSMGIVWEHISARCHRSH